MAHFLLGLAPFASFEEDFELYFSKSKEQEKKV